MRDESVSRSGCPKSTLVESLEGRLLMAFANWAAIGPAVALAPASAGQLSSVNVVNFGTTVYTGPLDVANTLNRIRADNGPDRTDDGIVYTNPAASGLPGDGTYYEFTVEPATGTDRTFTFASPGPMRVLLATGGDCYFTGDHYGTFEAVYLPGSTATPAIGSFSASPATVAAGATVTLTAANVAEPGGSIANVKFYRETDGTAGLQTGGDTLVGTGTATGTTYAVSAATAGFAAGTYTYYAVATDSVGTASATATTAVTVSSGTSGGPAGELVGWDVNGQTAYGTQGLPATHVAAGVTGSTGLTRGSAVTAQNTASANAWGGTGWSLTTGQAGAAAGQTVTVGLTVSAGYAASLSAVDLTYRHSGAGPTGGFWQYQVNGGAWGTIADVAGEFPAATGTIAELNLTGLSALQNLAAGTVVLLRLSPYAATSSGGNWYVNDGTGDDLTIAGTTTAVAAPLVLPGPADYLRLDPDGSRVDVWANTTGTGTPAEQVPVASVTTVTYAGTAGAADSLTVDFSAGDPLGNGGLTYDGGGGTGGANTLAVVGTAGNDTVTVTGTTVTLATAAFGSATITYAHVTALTVAGGTGGADTLVQSAQPGGGATLAFAATAADTLTVTGGTFTFPTPTAGAGAVGLPVGTLAVVGGGRVVVPSAAAAAADGTVLDVGEVDFAGGTLDLGRNAMVVHDDDLATVTAAATTGFAGGAWTGPGLASAAAAADPRHLLAVGVVPVTAAGTFLGRPTVPGDVLVRTTLYGDANLDGVVNAADYSRVDAGFVMHLTGWANGDLNYDGAVDGSDYALIDNAFNQQGAVAAPAVAVAVAAPTPPQGAKGSDGYGPHHQRRRAARSTKDEAITRRPRLTSGRRHTNTRAAGGG